MGENSGPLETAVTDENGVHMRLPPKALRAARREILCSVPTFIFFLLKIASFPKGESHD